MCNSIVLLYNYNMGRKPREQPIHNRLAVLRAERNLSRLQLADAIGVNFQTIGYLERGDYSPSLELAFRLAEYFDLPIEAIFARKPFAPLSRDILVLRGAPVSTMAAPAADIPDVTWRDAITPSSRASRRRWTICYALLLVLLAVSVVDDTFAVGRGSEDQIPIILIVALPVVFGMLRRGTRRITAFDHPDLDERDVAARNSAYRIAFPLLALVVVAALVLLAVAAPDADRTLLVGVTQDGSFVEPLAFVGLGLWIALWAIFLPTGVLAWREPDALESETGDGRLSERIRDALLGLALGGGIALVVLAESDSGLWPFVATLALLGGLGRRAAGQPMMSRQRKIRVAVGVAMILVLLFVALFAAAW